MGEVDDLKFPKPEPTKYDPKWLKLDIKLETSEHISWRVRKEHYENFNSVPKEKSQEILKCLKSSGLSVGEVAESLILIQK